MDTDDPHGWDAFWRLYQTGTWEPNTRALIDELIQPGDLLVDVGAWIGPVTAWGLLRGAKVIAIEPDSVAWGELSRRYGAHPDVELWPYAVGTAISTRRLAPNPKPGGAFGDSMSRLSSVDDDEDGPTVRVVPLPWILNHRVPKLVKIDIEGGEMDLLPTLGPWLARRHIALQVSCHGALPERAWLNGYREVRWTDDLWGDVVALP